MPLKFKSAYITKVERETMNVGDYCAEFTDGYRPPIVFDRKGFSDLWGTMATKDGHRRIKASVRRAQEQNLTMFIIVEGTFSKVLSGFERSKFKGISMIRLLMSFWIRHGCQTIFCKDRTEMAKYITNFYVALGKEHVRKLKEPC